MVWYDVLLTNQDLRCKSLIRRSLYFDTISVVLVPIEVVGSLLVRLPLVHLVPTLLQDLRLVRDLSEGYWFLFAHPAVSFLTFHQFYT